MSTIRNDVTLSADDKVEVVQGSGCLVPAFHGLTGVVVSVEWDAAYLRAMYEEAVERNQLRMGSKYEPGSPMVYGPEETIDLYLDYTYEGPYVEVEFSRNRVGFYPARNLARLTHE